VNSHLDRTHDPRRRSWVASANAPGTDFPIQNLPFGIFRPAGSAGAPRGGIAIGDRILDLPACHARGLFAGLAATAAAACGGPTLNRLMTLGPDHWAALRGQLSDLLSAEASPGGERSGMSALLVPMDSAELFLPAEVGDFTDFYASVYHATNVGRMFRPDNPLLPNYKYIPIGYHGRSSSIVASGTAVRRPMGQLKHDDVEAPAFGPSRLLDYELEVGFFVGPGNRLGEPIPIGEAERHIFGYCLVNDWSARDIQKWEYQPLGPFLAKNFATTVSPWIVTTDALAPFRAPAFDRPPGDPAPLPYLDSAEDRARGGVAITLEVYLTSARMRERGLPPLRLSRGSFLDMYWTPAQMLAHHASNGCNLRPGDLLASGTVSGDDPGSRGCLLELTSRGAQPIVLPTGEERRFLQDGDEVILRGSCEREGAIRIGFGECRGVVGAAGGM
jgi:fumarylacetoacetase